jgi:hypothetical protein
MTKLKADFNEWTQMDIFCTACTLCAIAILLRVLMIEIHTNLVYSHKSNLDRHAEMIIHAHSLGLSQQLHPTVLYYVCIIIRKTPTRDFFSSQYNGWLWIWTVERTGNRGSRLTGACVARLCGCVVT